ncbi:MAG: TfoX/Sxy family protein, partial [Gammaproteobacteria bacterium]|nr:TfoX/Sxy family protein [Gammaproteobacteria bacterium]
ARAMFGGYGIYIDKVMFALVADDELYLKVDDLNKTRFTDAGLEAFTYLKQGKPFKMSYFQAPADAMEEPEEMREWARSAIDAALRAAAKKR